jgi:hypothetical protein
LHELTELRGAGVQQSLGLREREIAYARGVQGTFKTLKTGVLRVLRVGTSATGVRIRVRRMWPNQLAATLAIEVHA